MSRRSTSARAWDLGRSRIASDAAGVALWSWDVDTDEIELDECAHCLWGVQAAQNIVTFEELSSHIHPQGLDRVRAAFTATRNIDGAYGIDFRVMHGINVRWISARGRGDDQGIVGRTMYGVFLDVTDRK
jgi:PAS domain-containing protein